MKNKKGIFFTIFVIIVLSLFLFGYTFSTSFKSRESTKSRITTLNNFVFSIDEDIPRQLYISGFRILFLIQKNVLENGTFVPNIAAAFEEAFFNGTIVGEDSEQIELVMEGAIFSDIVEEIQISANRINANVSINNPRVYLSQENPWSIKVTLSSNIFVKDLSDLAIWNKTENLSAEIPIEGFEDPLYLIYTNSLVSNRIIKSPFATFVSENDISNLSNHSLNSYYIASTSAPSFLKRFEGDFSGDDNGIESLVNLAELSSQNLPVNDGSSVVDYLYFFGSNPGCKVITPAGMPGWFRLDAAHLGTYQVSCV